MSIASAHIKHVFGFKSTVRGNVCYADDHTIVYPAGSNVVLYNVDQRTQKFITCTDKQEEVSVIAISPNRRYIAIAEKGVDKATITLFDLFHTSSRKKKALTSTADLQSNEFVSLAFSPDSKYIIAQGGKPDWSLLYWQWEKNKLLAKVITTNLTNNPINQCSFNPQDNTQICVVGQGIVKQYRYTEGAFKQTSFPKLEAQNFLCHVWLSDVSLVLGTETGKLMVFESGEMKHEISVSLNTSAIEGDKDANQSFSDTEIATSSLKSSIQINTVIAMPRGFACSVGLGLVHIYEKVEDGGYKKTREVRVPVDSSGEADPSRTVIPEINNLALSPSEETLVASTSNNQLYEYTLVAADIGRHAEAHEVTFSLLSQSFHSGSVTGLDVCHRKPYMATCSLDKTVKIWNYEYNILEIQKEFQEEIYCVALHPSGLYLCVGFSDKLRLMNILIDDIRTFKEFTIRGCRECAFSRGGHLFAAVQGNTIQIFSAVTFELLLNLKGHSGKVKSVVWAPGDLKLVSCGMDGAVYEWEASTGQRISESVLKNCSYTGVACSADGKSTYAVGSDRSLKEISDSQIMKDMETGSATLTQIAMTGRMLFAGTSSGMLRCVKYPLTVPGEWTDTLAHSSAITRMKITDDEEYLITVSDDSTIISWKITDKEGRSVKRDKDFGFAEEILITKSDLEEKNTVMSELKTRCDELKMENEYQLRLKDMNYNEKIKELTEKFIQEMESLKTKNQVLKTEKDKLENKHDEDIAEMLEKHSKETQDQDSGNNQKLMLEYEKYQELQSKSQKMQEDYERQLSEMEESKEQALEELTEYYETKLQEKVTQLEMASDESRQQVREYEETKKQIEEDADREILDIKTKYEKRLRDEKEANLRLKGETGIMRKKFTSLQKEIDDLKADIGRLNGEVSKLNGIIKSLERDIVGLKKEIQERDETIQDKEKRIYDLKKKNQELEKFKFVLDYKIKELKKQIEPRENEIQAKKEQIQEMESELDRFNKSSTTLKLENEKLQQKLKATEKELAGERVRIRDLRSQFMRVQTDIHKTVGYIQDPKILKDSIKALYQKYTTGDTPEAANVDADIQAEYGRQREHLEKSIASLRKKLVKDSSIQKADKVRIMQENVTLIKEINDLRTELKICRSKINDLEAQMGLAKNSNARVAIEQASATKRLSKFSASQEDDSDAIIVLQRQEIKKLAVELHEVRTALQLRPSSGGRLPPVINAM